jgi:hypothetical protein
LRRDLRGGPARINAVRARPILATALVAGIATGAWAALAAPGTAERTLRPVRDTGRVAVGAGLSVRLPGGWHLISRRLTDVVSPVQRLAVTSFVLPRRPPVGGCDPMMAVRRMPDNGAFLFMWEYAGATSFSRHDLMRFPPRPARFRLGFDRYGSPGGTTMAGATFREHGNVFQVQLYLGAHATRRRRAQLLAVLDSLTVRA